MKRRDKKNQEYLSKAYLFPYIGQIRFFLFQNCPPARAKQARDAEKAGKEET